MLKERLFLGFILSVRLTFFCQQGNNWYFGYNAGVSFNGGSPVALTDGELFTEEGCATISDENGNLLFYTDGISVFDRQHNLMANGFGLMGDPSSSQSGIIVPKPGNTNIYYIFTTDDLGQPQGLRYSEVDMQLNATMGDVTSNKNIPLLTPTSERLTAIKHANGIDYWVLSYKHTTREFYAYKVTAGGVETNPTISFDSNFGVTESIGYLKASTDGQKLASTDYLTTNIDVLNFDNSSGLVSLNFTFLPSISDAYGVEFSPDGTKLYMVGFTSGEVYQLNLELPSSNDIIASMQTIGLCNSPYTGAMQLGPDGKIYICRYSLSSISCIPNPNSLGVSCGFVENAIDLLSGVCTAGFPNIIQSYFNAPPINFAQICLGDSTVFSLAQNPTLDSLHWNFGDSATGINNLSNLVTPKHVFSDLGTYSVSVITYLGSISDTSIVSLTITGVPIVNLGNDTTVCNGIPVALNAGNTPCIWQDLSTNQTFTANTTGTYYVSVTNTCGTTTDTIIVTQVPVPVLDINDVEICLGETANLIVSGATTYLWSTGVTSIGANTAIANPVSTTSYQVTGSVGSCSTTESVDVVVHPLPSPNLSTSINAGCEILCVEFNENSVISYPSITYFFGTGDSSVTQSAQYCYESPGSYSVTIQCIDLNGCKGETNYQDLITVFPLPEARFEMSLVEKASLNEVIIFFNTSVGDSSILWDFGDPQSGVNNISILDSASHFYSNQGSYCIELTVLSSHGCKDSTNQCIQIISEIVIPNIFTPNHDGENDLFFIQNLKLGLAKLSIYSRWGNKVYSSDSYMNDWNGDELTEGVYFYVLDYSVDGKQYQGFVHLMGDK